MNAKRAWFAFWAAAVLVLPLRLWAAFHKVNVETGFYTDAGFMAGMAFVISAAAVLLFWLFGRGTTPAVPDVPLRSTPVAVFAALSGIVLAGESAAAIFSQQSSATVMDLIFAASGFLASVSFLASAYDFVSGEQALRKHPLLALMSSVWGCFGLIAMFVDYAAIANRLENVYHTFTASFLLLFLFSQAKVLSGEDGRRGAFRVFPFGLAALFLTLMDAIPNIALIAAGRKPLGDFPVTMYFAYLAIAAYIAAYLPAWLRSKTAVPAENAGADAANRIHPQTEAKPFVQSEKELEDTDGCSLGECLDYLNSVYGAGDAFQMDGRLVPAKENLEVS